MKPLSTDDLRQAYLDFFKERGHAVISGASLIPENDPTVLFTTAGMHPLVPYLLGQKHPAGTRLVDVQRCIRTVDIDEVGDTSHLTMFEMLGNWSLGDYFKKEAIGMSFEFLTEVLKLPVKKLAVTCFDGDRRFPSLSRDDESAEIWKSIGMPTDRIGFLEGGVAESKKNWWGPAGKTGPCGPDTEMFYWIGKEESPPPRSNPANDEQNWLEIWNDVFMQYNKKEDGTFEPLKQKNVDTGMGLERVAAVLQTKPGESMKSVYDTDAFLPIMEKIQSSIIDSMPTNIGTNMGPVDWIRKSKRIVADHLKASTFIIADGVRPTNVDQGYVLRKLLRRAIRSSRALHAKEIPKGFCAYIAEKIIDQYGDFYDQLKKQRAVIIEVLNKEEEIFLKTLAEGTKHLMKIIETATEKQLDGVTVFHLYDTYGFPLEITRDIAQEYGKTIDEAGYKKAFEEHQKLSRAGAEKKFAGGLADHSTETTKLHTATHLLNAALRRVLGEHVSQKGSNITAERLRFDFNHPEKMSPQQLAEVERLVNDAIRADLPVAYHVTTVDGAKKEGAIGVFGERYGKEVKVYVVGDGTFSKEICGGPHVARTGMLGSFKIQKEESSSAGIRRIKAIVSGGPKEIEMAKEAQ